MLDKLMADYGGFNHNHQSYRVVTEIEQRYDRWKGLNLTLETLEGLARHESSYDMSAVAGLPGDERGSVEAQIADAADELAYNAHDLDDGLKAGLITPMMLANLGIWQRVLESSRWDGTYFDDLTRHHIIRELVGLLVDDVITTTSQNLKALNPQSSLDVQHHTLNVVGYSDPMRRMNADLKTFLREHMYSHFQIVRMSQRAERFISKIFESYITEPRQLPDSYQQLIADEGVQRVVADYIASMTDRSALMEYRRLFDPDSRPETF